ncbi:Alpha/Beta hydrolase protein, partial [Chytridium lagenaria]
TTRGFFAVDTIKKTIYITFRGSANIQNWVSDFSFIRSPLNIANMSPSAPYAQLARDSEVHGGYQRAYDGVRLKVRNAFQKVIKTMPDAKIHATGYSYGCAMAHLAIIDLIISGFVPASKATLTGFGCTRTGNYEFARLTDTVLGLESVKSVMHSYDIFTRFPQFGSRHTGLEVW